MRPTPMVDRPILVTLVATLFAAGLLPAAEAGIRPRPADWATPMLAVHLENLHQVTPEIYRSEQPDDEAFTELRHFGIQSVLNLRDNHDDDDEAEGTGIALYRDEIETDDIGDAEVVAALRILRKAPKPVLVHCWHGADRTGCVIAMYRILYQGWTREQAIDELVNGGYDFHAMWDNIPEYLRTTDLEAVKAAVEAP